MVKMRKKHYNLNNPNFCLILAVWVYQKHFYLNSNFFNLLINDIIIVVRNEKIVWKLGPNGPSLLNNLCTLENSTQSFSICNKCKQIFLRENRTLQNLTLVKFLIAINSVITFDMPEDNRTLPGCSTSRATPGVALLGMPGSDGERGYNVNQRRGIVDMITKIRMVDATILGKIFGTKQRDPVKLDRTRKV